MDKKICAELLEMVFAPEGILARSNPTYEERPAQKAMAEQVFEAYRSKQIALIEAGTGTGKSLGYLAGAVLWAARCKARTVISTHTIALQHQLIEKDVPLLLKALDLEIKAVVVKGMGNYLCWKRLEENEQEQSLVAGEGQGALQRLRVWAENSSDGSRSSLPFPMPGAVWESVGAERESCIAKKCPHFKKCFFFKARKAAEEAQILIVNHHLLLLDCLDKKKGDEEEKTILPEYKRLVIDEAHHLEDIALEILAVQASKREILALFAKLMSEREEHPGPLQKLRQHLISQSLSTPSLLFRLETEFPQLKAHIGNRVTEAFAALDTIYMHVKPTLKKWRLQEVIQNNPYWQTVVVPAFDALTEDLKKAVVMMRSLVADLPANRDDKQVTLSGEILQVAENIEEIKEVFDRFFHPSAEVINDVRWFEKESDNQIAMICADLDIASRLSSALFSPLETAVLCSATLCGGNDFSLIRNRLGISALQEVREITECIYPSPFDFASRVLLAIPSDFPDPSAPQFGKEAMEVLREILDIVEGGAFVLFTSYEMLQQFYRELQPILERKGFTLLRQGEEDRMRLLQRFRKASKGVLFGTDSFWEGVDIAGDALRCVVIVKLPFQVPNDPLVEAQHEAITKQGGNPFYDLTVPKAAMKFKQGFGRLMRSKDDRGCVVCLDPRLLSKSYGKRILSVLPTCKNSFGDRSKILTDLREFFGKI